MEIAFKIVFVLAIIVFCLAVIGFFLLFIKILFMFIGEFSFFGIHFNPTELR